MNSVLLFVFCGQKGLKQMRFTLKCVQCMATSVLRDQQYRFGVRSLLTRVILLHDNTRPHTARLTLETVEQLGFEALPHPPYSPDLAPSDYHLFGPVKKMLGGQKFASDTEVQSVVCQWL